MKIVFGNKNVLLEAGITEENMGIIKITKCFETPYYDINNKLIYKPCDSPCILYFKDKESMTELYKTLDHVRGCFDGQV